jgi:hypothetical protein
MANQTGTIVVNNQFGVCVSSCRYFLCKRDSNCFCNVRHDVDRYATLGEDPNVYYRRIDVQAHESKNWGNISTHYLVLIFDILMIIVDRGISQRSWPIG